MTNDVPLVRELEEKVVEYLGVKHAICVSSGTVGLQIAAKVLLPPRQVVIMPSWTFPATATSMSWIGFTPQFTDVELNTHLMRIPDMFYKAVAFLGVHIWGNGLKIGVPYIGH